MKQYRGYIIGVIMIIISVAIIISFSYYSRVTLSELIIIIYDVSLELAITFALLLILLGTGSIIQQWSFNKQLDHPHSQQSENSDKKQWTIDFWQGISTELYGAVITGISLGMFVLVFQQYGAIQHQKEQLILQMESPDRTLAIEAVRQLSAYGWLADGTISNQNMYGSDLSGASFAQALMTGMILHSANLSNASFRDANLTSSDLTQADLSNANLQYAVLTNARLPRSDLQGANLRGANLQSTILTNTLFDENTRLPDGTYWTPDTDMARFTYPEHPDFWNPCVDSRLPPWYCS